MLRGASSLDSIPPVAPLLAPPVHGPVEHRGDEDDEGKETDDAAANDVVLVPREGDPVPERPLWGGGVEDEGKHLNHADGEGDEDGHAGEDEGVV